MTSIADSVVLQGLVERLGAVRPDSPRQWGTLTAAEMLCHLGDATASVMSRAGSAPGPSRPIMKWIALRSPLSWPKGLKTPERVDPKAGGTKPSDFEADRRRAIDGLRTFAAAPAESLAPGHGAFGRMTLRDWHRWAYRHTDHHLRQFGL